MVGVGGTNPLVPTKHKAPPAGGVFVCRVDENHRFEPSLAEARQRRHRRRPEEFLFSCQETADNEAFLASCEHVFLKHALDSTAIGNRD